MIKISVDEAVAYDMLAILWLKQQSVPTEAGQLSYRRLNDELTLLGHEKHQAILDSEEYNSLLKINREVFNLLVRLNTEGPWDNDAFEIDKRNYQRHPVKQALQKRFFPNFPLTERKTY